jgi:hypothetical protein
MGTRVAAIICRRLPVAVVVKAGITGLVMYLQSVEVAEAVAGVGSFVADIVSGSRTKRSSFGIT